MKHYKSVEFLSLFRVSSPPAQTQNPFAETQSPYWKLWRRFWWRHLWTVPMILTWTSKTQISIILYQLGYFACCILLN